jgi:hypothetical protein
MRITFILILEVFDNALTDLDTKTLLKSLKIIMEKCNLYLMIRNQKVKSVFPSKAKYR